MNSFLILLFVMIILFLCILFFRKKNIYEKQLEGLYKAKEQESAKAQKLKQFQDMVWQSINTIHLYAALSEEQNDLLEIKENQQFIQKECEKIEKEL